MLKQITKKIEESNKIALFHHINPDGDTLSSSYGLALALKKAYPDKEIKVVANKANLFDRFPFINFKEEMFIDTIDESWIVVVGDTSTNARIDRYEEFQKGNFRICFDHHRDAPTIPMDLYWQESTWIASSMQAVEIAKATGVEFNEDIAFHLAIGILTDSGHFVFSRADSFPVKQYAFLLDFIGDDKMDHFFSSMRERSKKDIEIEKFILNNMQFKKNLTYLKVTQDNLKELGVDEQDFKIKVNRLGNIKGYDRWAMFIEVEEYIKISTRSIGPNVQSIAVKHNGGGHLRAAGMRAKDWNEVEIIIDELTLAE